MVKKLMTGKSHSADPFDDEPEKILYNLVSGMAEEEEFMSV